MKKKRNALGITAEGTVGLVLFLTWLHGPNAVLRGIGEACIAVADAPPLVLLTPRQLDGIIGVSLLKEMEKRS